MQYFLVDTSATPVSMRDVFIPNNMPPRRCVNEVPVEEDYECDRMMQLDQQVETLMQQLTVLLANQNQNQRQDQNLPYLGANSTKSDEDYEKFP